MRTWQASFPRGRQKEKKHLGDGEQRAKTNTKIMFYKYMYFLTKNIVEQNRSSHRLTTPVCWKHASVNNMPQTNARVL